MHNGRAQPIRVRTTEAPYEDDDDDDDDDDGQLKSKRRGMGR